MSLLINISLFICIVILGFFFFLFSPKPTVFYSKYIESTEEFTKNHDAIVSEIEKISSDWPVIPIYGRGRIYNENFPILYKCLQSVPGVRYAGIINIKPKFEQRREYGFDEISNHTLRCFYTVNHSATRKSGIWIDGARQYFECGEWIYADTSKEHALFNKSKDEITTVVFIDVDRTGSTPAGKSPNMNIMNDSILKVFELVDKYELIHCDDNESILDLDDNQQEEQLDKQEEIKDLDKTLDA